MAISAVSGLGIPELLRAIDERLKQRSDPVPPLEETVGADLRSGGQ
jgi:hypothetical protein